MPVALLPCLSIVLPVLEPDSELRRCIAAIDSVFADPTLVEIVVVSPAHVVDEIATAFPRVRAIAESGRGIYRAMNDGARASTGRNLYFLGKDDILLPTFAAAVEVLQRAQPFALFCDVYWGSRGVFRASASKLRVLVRNYCHQGIVYSRPCFEQHGPYVRKMRVQADHLLNIKTLWKAPHAGANLYLSVPVAWYSGSGFSAIHRDAVFWRLYPTILRRYVGAWAAMLIRTYRAARGR